MENVEMDFFNIPKKITTLDPGPMLLERALYSQSSSKNREGASTAAAQPAAVDMDLLGPEKEI
jgi:hypothetical protein